MRKLGSKLSAFSNSFKCRVPNTGFPKILNPYKRYNLDLVESASNTFSAIRGGGIFSLVWEELFLWWVLMLLPKFLNVDPGI